uniref:Splicing factor 3A subunit 3 n=1 Tax=Echinostoma caproni TaxID=27848 RepID=A0A183B0A6_9TREM
LLYTPPFVVCFFRSLRKVDIQALSGPNEFNEFYNRLKNIKDFYAKYPGEIAVPMSADFEKYKEMREKPEEASATLIEFTDEEGYGRFLDLHDVYKKYLNVKGMPRIDYLTYISFFDRLYDISRDKKGIAYKTYLEDLLSYLEDFMSRARPLVDLEVVSRETKEALEKFDAQWSQGTFNGWGREAASALTHGGAHLDLTAFTAWEELASLGLDRLKSALLALGLKCGGTLEERARRLWATKGKSLEELPADLFVTKQRSTKGFAKTAVVRPLLCPRRNLTQRLVCVCSHEPRENVMFIVCTHALNLLAVVRVFKGFGIQLEVLRRGPTKTKRVCHSRWLTSLFTLKTKLPDSLL